MGFSLNKLNPFDKDNFDPGRAALAVMTGGVSVGIEAGVELTGEAIKKTKLEDDITEFGNNVVNDATKSFMPNQNPELPALTQPQQDATREIFDPRRNNRRGSGSNNSSMLTGQYDSQPSLIG